MLDLLNGVYKMKAKDIAKVRRSLAKRLDTINRFLIRQAFDEMRAGKMTSHEAENIIVEIFETIK